MTSRPRLRRLAPAVRDQARARRLDETHVGFDGVSALRYPDTLILRHTDDGFSAVPALRFRRRGRKCGYVVEASWEIPQPNE